MSQWTHVNAIIRFDGIKGITPDPELGHTVNFDDHEDTWDKCDIPCGDAGSLQYELKEVGEGIPRFVASIWGDLQDYSDIDEIERYLNRIVSGQLIRSGVAEINVECGITKVLRYTPYPNSDSGKWQTVWESK